MPVGLAFVVGWLALAYAWWRSDRKGRTRS